MPTNKIPCRAGEADREAGGGESGEGLYDPRTDVITCLEVLSDADMKAVFHVMYAGLVAGTGLLLALFGMKMSGEYDDLVATRPVVLMNAAVAAFDVALVTCCIAIYLARVVAANRAGLRWSRRRLRVCCLFMVQLLSVFVGNVFFLVPNVYVAKNDCGYFDRIVNASGLIRWTAWNTLLAAWVINVRCFNLMVDDLGHPLGPRQDQTYLDAPWNSHWPIAAYWLVFLASSAGMAANCESELQRTGSCIRGHGTCKPDDSIIILTTLLVALSFGYLATFVHYARRAFALYAKKSYVQFRWGNMGLRFTVRLVGVVLAFGILSFSFLWYTRLSSCLSYVASWLGFGPLQLVLSVFTVVNMALTIPTRPGSDAPLRMLPCNKIWLERSTESHKEACRRGGWNLCPLFCYETAVRCLYWAELIYDYPSTKGAEADTGFDIATAMSLFGLSHFEYMSAREVDSHAIVAWSNEGTIVLCFRGTSSATNVLSDLKFWRVAHPPKRGMLLLGTRPLVHKGFWRSWQGGNFGKAVMDKIWGIIANPEFRSQDLNVLVTGHSLGGAVAVLAAHDIARYCGLGPDQISCYTFGCPRIGNHRFAADHNKAVPNTWHVINNLDVVPRMPKLLTFFKRCGERAVVNGRGDLIVSPIFLEFKASSAFMGKIKVANHLLSAYRKSLSAVALAQFHRYKALRGGREAIQELLDKGDITTVLGVSAESANALQRLSSAIWKRRSHNLDHDRLRADARFLAVLPVPLLGWLSSMLWQGQGWPPFSFGWFSSPQAQISSDNSTPAADNSGSRATECGDGGDRERAGQGQDAAELGKVGDR